MEKSYTGRNCFAHKEAKKIIKGAFNPSYERKRFHMKCLFTGKTGKFSRIIILFLTLTWTVFILSRSMNDASASNDESNRIVEIAVKIAEALGIKFADVGFLSHIIRKCAHFVEFGILGMLSFFTGKLFKLKNVASITIPLVYCSIVAFTDEYIQKFSSGRASQMSDVLLDISGALFFVFVIYTGILLYTRNKNKNIYEN